MAFKFKDHMSGVQDLDKVPEKYRFLYEEDSEAGDGSYRVRLDAVAFVNETVGLGTALSEERGKVERLNSENAGRRHKEKALGELVSELGLEVGEDDDLIQVLRASIEDLTSKAKGGAEFKVDLDKIKEDFARKLAAAEEGHKEAQSKMRGSLEKYLRDNTARQALAEHKASADLLMPHIRDRVKVVEDGDDYAVRVVDSGGNIRYDGADPMGIEALVVEMKGQDTFKSAFPSESKGGSGQPPGSSARPSKPAGGEEKTSTQKIAGGLAALQRK